MAKNLHLDPQLVTRAVEGLLAFEKKKADESGSKSLVGDYSKPVFAVVQLKKEIGKPVVKPVRVKIPYSFFAPDENDDSICLFCRTEDKATIVEFLDKNSVEGLRKVVSLNDVKKEFKQLQDRKKLFKEHTHFLCDMRIVSHLYNLLGKTFLSRHSNSPVPIDYETVHGLPAAVNQSVSSSYMHLKGNNITIKLGTTIMSSKHVVKNVEQGLEFAVNKFQGGWKSVMNIHVKTSDSPSLPIFTKVQSESFLFVESEAKKQAEEKEEGKGGKAAKSGGGSGSSSGKGNPAGKAAGGSKKKK